MFQFRSLVAVALLAVAPTTVFAADAVMRYQFNVPLLLPSPADLVFEFSSSPDDITVRAGASGESVFSFESGTLPGASFTIVSEAAVPPWLVVSGNSVSAMPDIGAPVGEYGPFQIRATGADRDPATSEPFSVSVTSAAATFITQPTSVSVGSVETRSIPISVAGGYGSKSYSVVLAGTDTAAPSWITVNGSSVNLSPTVTADSVAHGPFEVKVVDAGGTARSSAFTVTVSAGSAATLKPFTAMFGNPHITNYNNGSTHGFPWTESTLIRDALYDGLDNPIVTYDWGGLTLVGLRFDKLVNVTTCQIRVSGATLPNPLNMSVSFSIADGTGVTTPITLSRSGDMGLYSGPCDIGKSVRAAYLNSVGQTRVTVTEFKVGVGGVYP